MCLQAKDIALSVSPLDGGIGWVTGHSEPKVCGVVQGLLTETQRGGCSPRLRFLLFNVWKEELSSGRDSDVLVVI